MANLTIRINQREFDIACSDGEEDHVRSLATILEQRVSMLKSSLGQVSDTQLLVLAGLMLCDELKENKDKKPNDAGIGHEGVVQENIKMQKEFLEILVQSQAKIDALTAQIDNDGKVKDNQL